MSVQPRSLTTTQAVDILETLSLLTSKQHQSSKLVIYETSIELESDSSTVRTIKPWALYAISSVQYIAGYTPLETGSRDIAELPPLLERVHQAFKDHQYDYAERTQKKQRIDLADRALNGLSCLVQHEYLKSAQKKGFVDLAQQKVREILAFLNNAGSFDYEDPLAKQLREKEREIALLKKENDVLNGLVAEKERYIAVVSQLHEKQKSKITRLEDLIVRDASRDDPLEEFQASTQVLIGRIHTLTGVLATRKH